MYGNGKPRPPSKWRFGEAGLDLVKYPCQGPVLVLATAAELLPLRGDSTCRSRGIVSAVAGDDIDEGIAWMAVGAASGGRTSCIVESEDADEDVWVGVSMECGGVVALTEEDADGTPVTVPDASAGSAP